MIMIIIIRRRRIRIIIITTTTTIIIIIIIIIILLLLLQANLTLCFVQVDTGVVVAGGVDHCQLDAVGGHCEVEPERGQRPVRSLVVGGSEHLAK